MDTPMCPTCAATVPVHTAATPCPGCGRALPSRAPVHSTDEPSWLREDPATRGGPAASSSTSVTAGSVDDDAAGESTDPSVRPPTVDRDDLPEPDRDPLAGWDVAPAPVPEPATPDWVVVTAAGATGMVAGAVLAPRGRGVGGALAGTLAGLAGAAIRRSVWRIDPPDGSWARRQHDRIPG